MTATVPTLDQLPAKAQEIVLAYYESGAREGYVRGWNAAQEAERAAWRAVAVTWGRPSQRSTFAELCERRGEPEKAAAHRRLLAERGIS